MAIVVDPDNLDRDQVIFGTKVQQLSLFPVGAKTSAVASSGTATVSVGLTAFNDTNALFTTTFDVTAGDTLVLRNGDDAAHFTVSAVIDANTLELATDDGWTGWTADGSALVYATHIASGGSIEDGVSLQALYSFTKEEWRTDTYATALSDDLIRHEYPFEPITSEQMEIGGGDTHADWTFFNEYTRKKVRTGGWADKNQAATASAEYTGVVTLGSLDTDAQVYYQQVSAQNDPTDFTFQGVVNEVVQIYSSAGGTDLRNYLKIFVRKKGKTYAQSEIADIGVTQLQTIVNRFPLTHADDSAIEASDAQVIGASPFHSAVSTVTASAGVTSATSPTVGSFRDSAAAPFGTTFIGDTLFITGTQTDAGYYTITSVVNASTVLVDTTENGVWTGATTLDYDVFSKVVTASALNSTAGYVDVMTISAGVSAAVAIASATGVTFVTDGAAVGDILEIGSATSDHEGLYQIVSVVSETRLLVDSTDNPFTTVTGVDFRVLKSGMYLQYKKEDITLAAVGNVTFASATNKITRSTGSWTGDGVTTGSHVAFGSTTSNDLVFTVASAGTTDIELVSTDAARITDEGPTAGASVTASDAFKRSISNVTYGFNWRLFGNGATLANCYQFVQHQLRQTGDIDWGNATFRGDVTDLLLSYATPTGTTDNMIIDDINADDTNNATYQDATGESRLFPFVSSLTISFNTNLQADASAKYRMFFTTNPSGDFSTQNAITVQDSAAAEIAGNVGGAPSVQATFDYDGNVQGGRSAGTDAGVTIVAIGLSTAQYVITTGTITRAKGLTFSLVSPLERNYLNP